MKYNGPKVRLSRRVGIPLTPKAAKVMERKPQRPGEARGIRRRDRPSDYSRQLLEKQRLRYQYNVHERQLSNYYHKSARSSGNTVENLVQHLERRVDVVILRAGFAKTIYAARQYVNHGHVTVNDRRANIPSQQVKVGDTVGVREKSKKLSCFREAMSHANVPPYLAVDRDELSAKIMSIPRREEAPIVCDFTQVIAFYSR